jgi:hypothetical protein
VFLLAFALRAYRDEVKQDEQANQKQDLEHITARRTGARPCFLRLGTGYKQIHQ